MLTQDDFNKAHEDNKSTETTLIIVIVVLVAVILAGLVAAIAFWVYNRRKQRDLPFT